MAWGLALLLVGWAAGEYACGLRVVGGASMAATLLAGDLVVVARPAVWRKRPYERGDVVVFSAERDGGRTAQLIKRVVGAPGDTVRAVGSEVWVNGVPLPIRGAMQRSWIVALRDGAALDAAALYRAGVKEIREEPRGVVVRPATRATAAAIASWPGVRSVRPCTDCQPFDLRAYVPRRGDCFSEDVSPADVKMGLSFPAAGAEGGQVTGTKGEGFLPFEGQTCAGENFYFVAGDNRDESEDSRTWGAVAERRIEGRVVMVLASWDPIRKRLRTGRTGLRIAPERGAEGAQGKRNTGGEAGVPGGTFCAERSCQGRTWQRHSACGTHPARTYPARNHPVRNRPVAGAKP